MLILLIFRHIEVVNENLIMWFRLKAWSGFPMLTVILGSETWLSNSINNNEIIPDGMNHACNILQG